MVVLDNMKIEIQNLKPTQLHWILKVRKKESKS